MFYQVDQLSQAYRTILKNSSSHSSCQLVIFVSCLNIDALCATKILSQVFKKQLVQLQIVPVVGYSELKRHYLQLDSNINSVILVGFGASVDLETFLDIEKDEATEDDPMKRLIYVLDAHRPWNLDNLFGSDVICCLDDGTVQDSLQEEQDAYMKLVELEQEREDDSEDDGLSDSDEEEEEEEDPTDEDEDDEDGPHKRKLSQDINPRKKQIKERRKLILQNERLLEEYYSCLLYTSRCV